MENDEQKQTEQTATPEATANKKPKKWLIPTIIGVVIVVVLALCGGGYYYHFTHTMKDYMPNSYVTFKQTNTKDTTTFLGEKSTNKDHDMNNQKLGFVLAKNGKLYNLKKAKVPSKESVANFIKGKKAVGTYEIKGNDQLILHFNVKDNSDLSAMKDAGVKFQGKSFDFKFTDMKGSLQKGLNGKISMGYKIEKKGLTVSCDIHGNVTNMKVTRR